jgi:hypothetical protein
MVVIEHMHPRILRTKKSQRNLVLGNLGIMAREWKKAGFGQLWVI